MKILRKDLKHGKVKVEAETGDDAWYLSQIIEPGDLVQGSTERKIKIGGEDERNKRITRKRVFLSIRVEKTELQGDALRVGGVVEQGHEDVPTGSHHTFSIEEGTIIEVSKEYWPNYILEKLKEASERVSFQVLICCHDREQASFGLLTHRGLEILSGLEGDVAKKGFDENVKGGFYTQVSKALQEYDKRLDPDNIVIASPGFWKEYLMKEIPEELAKKVTQATCSTVDERGLHEVVKRPELKQVLRKDRSRKDSLLVDEVMKAVSQDKACYGLDDCEEKVSIGAVEKLLVSDKFMSESRGKGIYSRLEGIMKSAEGMDGDVHIVSSEGAGRKLDGLGGIAGVLRWKATA